MAQLTSAEMTLVDALFDMYSGSPLHFSNSIFQSFFANDVGIDIYAPRYAVHGDSKGKRLRGFLDIASAASIAKALRALWEVRESIRLGRNEADTVPHARVRLDAVIVRLGGRPLPPAFDEPAPAVPPPETPKGPSETAQASLETGFNMLHALDDAPHARGYAFEGFLKSWFDTWGLGARKSFKLGDGEQIDGSFVHRNSVFLLEAKWKNTATDAGALHAFQGKVGERLEGARRPLRVLCRVHAAEPARLHGQTDPVDGRHGCRRRAPPTPFTR